MLTGMQTASMACRARGQKAKVHRSSAAVKLSSTLVEVVRAPEGASVSLSCTLWSRDASSAHADRHARWGSALLCPKQLTIHAHGVSPSRLGLASHAEAAMGTRPWARVCWAALSCSTRSMTCAICSPAQPAGVAPSLSTCCGELQVVICASCVHVFIMCGLSVKSSRPGACC